MKEKLHRALRWSEKYTRTDMVYLTKGGFWLTTSKLLSFLAFFISSVAFANLLPQNLYGTFQYAISIIGLLSIATLFGIETSLTRSIAKGNYADFNKALFTRIKWGILGGIAGLFIAGYYFVKGNEMLSMLFLMAALFVPFMDSFHTYTSVLSGKKKFNILARDEVATRMGVSLLLAALVYFTDNIYLILFSFLFTTTVLRLLFLLQVFKTEPKNTSSDPKMIPYGKHLTFMGILGRASSQIDKILIFQFTGAIPLATYFISLVPLKAVKNLLNGIVALAMPKFSNNSLEELRTTLPGKIIRMYAFILPIVILYELTAPIFYEVLYPLYPEAILMSQVAFLQILFFPISLFHTAITSQQNTNKLYINSTFNAVIRVALIIYLVPTYGAVGAIAALLITSLISSVLLVYLFFKN